MELYVTGSSSWLANSYVYSFSSNLKSKLYMPSLKWMENILGRNLYLFDFIRRNSSMRDSWTSQLTLIYHFDMLTIYELTSSNYKECSVCTIGTASLNYTSATRQNTLWNICVWSNSSWFRGTLRRDERRNTGDLQWTSFWWRKIQIVTRALCTVESCRDIASWDFTFENANRSLTLEFRTHCF